MDCCNSNPKPKSTNKLFWGIIILIAIVGGIVFVKNSRNQGTATDAQSNIKEFNIKAFRYAFNPNTITVNEGDKVKITINNSDTLHGINIPDLGVSGNDTLEFTASKKGEFTWYCNNYCGDSHSSMQGKLIVL